MKRNSLTVVIGLLLLLIFGALLFCFQVRQTEVALVTRFGRPSRNVTEPGLNLKWPWPVEKVQRFDKRVQNLESQFAETFTADKITVIVTVFAGWEITDPALFRERFGDSVENAQGELVKVVRNANSGVIANHSFSELISTDPAQMKLGVIETEVLDKVQPAALAYGMKVRFLGLKRIGLPESTTANIINRMKEERQAKVKALNAEGESLARNITSDATLQRDKLLNEARAKATEILGQADAESKKSLAVLNQNPELGIFLVKVAALEESLTNRATLILDQRTSPFDLLDAGKGGLKK